ncbi:MAG: MFS transporter [Candidatus Cloacimonetes bacterium]|nr:MFS transporter [Candidatus Cloacimonadota bacterium]
MFSKDVLGWISYDFANSSFTTIIVTVVYSVYFKNTVVGIEGLGDYFWGISISLSMLVVAILAPIFGAISDYTRAKKKFLFVLTYVGVLCTALLYFIRAGNIFLGMIFFIIANICFEGGMVFYNGFLPEIVRRENIGKISGWGWGIGYLGGLASLGITFLVLEKGTIYVFPSIALFFGVFALPIFIFLKEKKRGKAVIGEVNYIKVGYNRILRTFKNIRKFKELGKFLLAFFFYNDGVKTIIAFAAIYGASRFGMTYSQLVIYFVIANVASFIGAIFFGYILDWIGAKKTIIISLFIWLGVVIAAYFCETILQFYGVGILAGIGIGVVQSASRSLVSMLTPKDKHAEFFGFYAVSGKASAIIGPAVYGLIMSLVKNQRMAILSIGIFFVIGLMILTKVNVKNGMKQINN